MKIRIAFTHPPTPCPPFWEAWDDDLGTDTSLIGRGATQQEAIDDLMARMGDAK
jgi:hypothetical protein